MSFHDRLISTGLRSLYRLDYSENILSYNVTISTLQRMVIHELQRKLVLNVKDIVRNHEVTEACMKTAQDLLAQYSMFPHHRSLVIYDSITQFAWSPTQSVITTL